MERSAIRGLARGNAAPDFASLHPGYLLKHGFFDRGSPSPSANVFSLSYYLLFGWRLPHQREAEVIVVPWLIRFWTQSWKFTPSRHLGSCFAASAGSEFSPTISVANAITNLRIASPCGP